MQNSHKKFIRIQSNGKIGKREIATQVTKCNEFQRNKLTFLKETMPKKKSLNCKTWISIAKTRKTH